jgi:phosphoglycolate phosphatase
MTTPTINRPVRNWDSYDAYLFDIDGTLLRCGAVHYFAFCEALTALAGRPLNLDGVTTEGNTDIGILRDALTLADVPDEVWRPRAAETRAAMCQYVEENSGQLNATLMPAVVHVLEHLRKHGAVLGIATGNVEGIARLKLRSCGIEQYFEFAACSNEHEYRAEIFRCGLSKARLIAGATATICVVGDTPADVQAAKKNGLDIIAVATGVHSFEELAAESPTWCLKSLEELVRGSKDLKADSRPAGDQ